MNAEPKTAMEEPNMDKASLLTTEAPAHLAFRQIILHEFSEGADPQPLRLHFHFRDHSKHLSRRGTS